MALTTRIKAVIRSLGKRGDPLASATSDLIKSVETLEESGGAAPSDGLVITGSNLKANLGDGLEFDSSSPKKIRVKANELNGIEVTPDGLKVLAFVATGGLTTTDDTPTDLLTVPLGGGAKGYGLRVTVVGHKSDGTKVCAYDLLATVRTDGTTAVVANTTSKTAVDTELNADATVVASGNNVVVQVTGVAATEMKWKVLGRFI